MVGAGGIRLEPAWAEGWGALGVAAGEVAVREYCLSRSLMLQPRGALFWAALARLYCEAGEAVLADVCLSSARSHDPTLAPVWEAQAALATLSPSGTQRPVGSTPPGHPHTCLKQAIHVPQSPRLSAYVTTYT